MLQEHGMITRSKHGIAMNNPRYALQISAAPRIPTCVSQALETQEWVQVKNNEMMTLKQNETWVLVDREPGQNVPT